MSQKSVVSQIVADQQRALKYVHSAGVVHRDLKPGNILIDENCDLKICDFGLARTLDLSMTGYVTTRFYRAPETMLAWQKYGVEIDMWSAGCILAEMLEGKPLFSGRDHADQFLIISNLLGYIHPDSQTLNYIEALPFREKRPLNDRLKNASSDALDILESLLVWNPGERISAAAALPHPYLSLYHDPTDESQAQALFGWALVDSKQSVETWKSLIFATLEMRKRSSRWHHYLVKRRFAVVSSNTWTVRSSLGLPAVVLDLRSANDATKALVDDPAQRRGEVRAALKEETTTSNFEIIGVKPASRTTVKVFVDSEESVAHRRRATHWLKSLQGATLQGESSGSPSN
ncbi:Mitogen-activated protein kinase HOG1 [Penicillium sp. IBT 35674x]|nr:Mitogen-activated protein kinase HOG1 [Penicillium sp. IBT 35674x]